VHRGSGGLAFGRRASADAVEPGGEAACWANQVDDETGAIGRPEG
jgi:hypothetical protein